MLHGGQPEKVHIYGIDAPKRGQPFGTHSRVALERICFQKLANVERVSIGRYGRAVGRVKCAGTDAAAYQVHNGYAWTFGQYAEPGSILYKLEHSAKNERRGLWRDPHAIAPWEWRQHRRQDG